MCYFSRLQHMVHYKTKNQNRQNKPRQVCVKQKESVVTRERKYKLNQNA